MGINEKQQVKSKKRVADHGEVFTADREVNAMLDLVKQESERIESRFFEPACGNGNFLHMVLERKMNVVSTKYAKNSPDFDKYLILSLSTIYGVELLEDNAQECRNRLFEFFIKFYKDKQKKEPIEDIKKTAKYILSRNILCGDALTLLASDGQPIIFSEWSLVNNEYFKRRDFKLAEMLSFPPATKEEKRLNSEYVMDDLLSDISENNLTIRVYKEYPLIKYWRVGENE